MTIFVALWLWVTEPYLFRRRHEWRRPSIDRTMLFPKFTIGPWTWDALGPDAGVRIAEVVDVLGRDGRTKN